MYENSEFFFNYFLDLREDKRYLADHKVMVEKVEEKRKQLSNQSFSIQYFNHT